ncbi:MAG: hypothetical protein ACYDCK_00700 [Thermoplasmatota archaeon]
MRLGWLLPTLLVLATVLSGCTRPSGTLSASSAALPPPAKYLYACGGVASAKPCVAELGDLRTAYQEPNAAADPTRAGVFAVGINAYPSAIDRAADAPSGESATCRDDILLTTGAGAHWTYVKTPRPALATGHVSDYCGGDPALAFDAKGVLHLTGIATADAEENGFEVFYTSSPDLGKTWTKPVTLSRGANEDRNWIGIDAADRLYVVWQFFDGDGGSAVATSADGGATWDFIASDAGRACFVTSPPIFNGTTMMYACSNTDSSKPELRVVAFHPETRTSTIVAKLPIYAIWPTLAWVGKTLDLFIQAPPATEMLGGSGEEQVMSSADGGHNWTKPVAAKALLPDDMTSGDYWLQWAATDTWGRLHLLWRATDNPAGASPRIAPPVSSAYAHTVVGTDGVALQRERIGFGESLTNPTPPKTLGNGGGNDYMGIAFNGADGILVFSENGELEYAMLHAATNATT